MKEYVSKIKKIKYETYDDEKGTKVNIITFSNLMYANIVYIDENGQEKSISLLNKEHGTFNDV